MNLGVKVTRTNSTVDELWGATFLARLAFLRPGKHLCISWHVIDHLVMGRPSCKTARHTRNGPCRYEPLTNSRSAAAESIGTSRCGQKPIMGASPIWLALFVDPERQAAIRRESAIYFDQRVAPEQVPRYLIATEEQSVSAPSQHAIDFRFRRELVHASFT
jgi:hypothetical protein